MAARRPLLALAAHASGQDRAGAHVSFALSSFRARSDLGFAVVGAAEDRRHSHPDHARSIGSLAVEGNSVHAAQRPRMVRDGKFIGCKIVATARGESYATVASIDAVGRRAI